MPRYLISLMGIVCSIGSFFLPWFKTTLRTSVVVAKGTDMEHFFILITAAGLLGVLALVALSQKTPEEKQGFAYPVLLACGVFFLVATIYFDYVAVQSVASKLAARKFSMEYGLYVLGGGLGLVVLESIFVFMSVLELRQKDWEKIHERRRK